MLKAQKYSSSAAQEYDFCLTEITKPTAIIDHTTTFMKLTEADLVRQVQVIGEPAGWAILVQYGMIERVLAAQRSHQIRLFRKLGTLVLYLRSVGIARFTVHAAAARARLNGVD